MWVLYNILLLCLSPVLAVYYLWRVVGSGKARGAWRQQMGFLPKELRRSSKRPRIWIQAVSVGEVVAASPILRELRILMPDAELIVSTTTTTGQEMARRSLKEADHVIFFPLDLPPFVRRSVSIIRPDVFVSVESEIWPNFLSHLCRMGIPALVVNGIVSERTLRWGKRSSPVYKWALSNVNRFLMQTTEDARRITLLGAPASRVEVVGNCKFDQEVDPLTPEQVGEMRRLYGFMDADRVFVAGSTNPGEDVPVLEAFRLVRQSHPDLRLVIAPRQIERADEIIEIAQAQGFSCGRRSAADSITGREDVVILDTFGELAKVYGIADAAFVGGSLIPKGGHNILQPIAQGKPVLYGPYTFKAADLVAQAEAAGVGFEVKGADELAERLSGFLSNGAATEELRTRALAMIKTNKGASRRCAQAVVEAIGDGG